jgi:hypothetical protein
MIGRAREDRAGSHAIVVARLAKETGAVLPVDGGWLAS